MLEVAHAAPRRVPAVKAGSRKDGRKGVRGGNVSAWLFGLDREVVEGVTWNSARWSCMRGRGTESEPVWFLRPALAAL